MTPAKRLAVGGVMAAATLGAASATYQQISDARDRRRYPPPGRLVDIGGRRLHLFEAGSGEPPVVIIPALNSNVLEWMQVVRELQGETRGVVYDRAGIGWSDPPGFRRRTWDDMAAELHAMLAAAGIGSPYVLAGHSLGGLVARRFAARWPEAVAGMVLIDSSHEGQFHRLRWREGAGSNLWRAVKRRSRLLGARRLAAGLGLLTIDVDREAPPEYAAAARAILLSSRYHRTAVRELLMTLRLRGQPVSLGSLPLTVITSAEATQRLNGRPWKGRPAWERMQAELAALSTCSRHVIADKAGHYIHLDEPDLVVEAIRGLVIRCR